MFPDRWGSDADYDRDHGNDWSLDEARVDWCEAHQQRGSTCGKCHAEAMDDAEADFWAATTSEDDERMGADLSARFEVTREA